MSLISRSISACSVTSDTGTYSAIASYPSDRDGVGYASAQAERATKTATSFIVLREIGKLNGDFRGFWFTAKGLQRVARDRCGKKQCVLGRPTAKK